MAETPGGGDSSRSGSFVSEPFGEQVPFGDPYWCVPSHVAVGCMSHRWRIDAVRHEKCNYPITSIYICEGKLIQMALGKQVPHLIHIALLQQVASRLSRDGARVGGGRAHASLVRSLHAPLP